jgi:hypothetical protein
MTDPTPPKPKRTVNVGEIVAVGGLAISALALWNSWRGDDAAPKTEVATPDRVPLALRGKVEDEGKAIRIDAVEPGHALEALTLTALPPAKGSASFGSEPILSAAGIEEMLPDEADGKSNGALILAVEARYIERGEVKTASQRYRIAYRWVEGGLLGGNSVRLTALTRE